MNSRLTERWREDDSASWRWFKTTRDVVIAGAAGWTVGVVIALVIVILFGALSGCAQPTSGGVGPIILVTPLPTELTKYVPAVDDDYGVPIRSADEPAAPVMWLWPSGVVNVTALQFSAYYPQHLGFAQSPKGGHDIRVNVLGQVSAGVSPGWQAIATTVAVNDSSRFALPGFTEADVPVAQIVGTRVVVVAVTDSVLEVTAELFYTAGAELDTARTYARLVHERFGR